MAVSKIQLGLWLRFVVEASDIETALRASLLHADVPKFRESAEIPAMLAGTRRDVSSDRHMALFSAMNLAFCTSMYIVSRAKGNFAIMVACCAMI